MLGGVFFVWSQADARDLGAGDVLEVLPVINICENARRGKVTAGEV